MCMFLKRYHKNADVLQVNCGIDFTREAVLLCHDQVDVSVELRVGEHNFGQIDYFAQLVEGPSAKCLPKVLVIVNDHVNPEKKDTSVQIHHLIRRSCRAGRSSEI